MIYPLRVMILNLGSLDKLLPLKLFHQAQQLPDLLVLIDPSQTIINQQLRQLKSGGFFRRYPNFRPIVDAESDL